MKAAFTSYISKANWQERNTKDTHAHGKAEENCPIGASCMKTLEREWSKSKIWGLRSREKNKKLAL